MTHSYNIRMSTSVNPRLDNLLASLSLNLAEESAAALEEASGLTGSAALALLALEEFLGDTHVGRLADVLGLTHSGAVRLVSQLEAAGLAERRTGADRRRVEVRLTAAGRRRAGVARAARDAVLSETTGGLSGPRPPTSNDCSPSSSRRGWPPGRSGAARATPGPGGAAPATSRPAGAPRAAARPR